MRILHVTIGTCVFCADGIMITNNSYNNYVLLNVFMFRIMSMTLRKLNQQKEIFHHYDFPVYTTSKYRDRKLDTYRRITFIGKTIHTLGVKNVYKTCHTQWCTIIDESL